MGRKAIKPPKKYKLSRQNQPRGFKLKQNILTQAQARHLALSPTGPPQATDAAPTSMLRTDGKIRIFYNLPKLNTRSRSKSLTYRLEKKEESLNIQLFSRPDGLRNRLQVMGRCLKRINRLIGLRDSFSGIDSLDNLGFKKSNPACLERYSKLYVIHEKTKESPANILMQSSQENKSHFRGSKCVLLVDRDEAARDVYASMLSFLGYQVAKCENSRKALKAFQGKPDSYILLLINLSKRAKRGNELTAEFRKIRPDMPVILYAGHPDKLAEEAIDSGTVDKVIYEPLSLIGLEKAIKEVLA